MMVGAGATTLSEREGVYEESRAALLHPDHRPLDIKSETSFCLA